MNSSLKVWPAELKTLSTVASEYGHVSLGEASGVFIRAGSFPVLIASTVVISCSYSKQFFSVFLN